MTLRPLLIITGPTASGKSALALELCERLGGEIVSCDSMQIYRECDIATAKPTAAEQRRVPHHLLNVCDPNERFSAAQWAATAREVIDDIEGRGKVPVVCGGTGFYLRALLDPHVLSEVEPDEELRAGLDAELAREGAEAMHAKLTALDPAAGARLHPNDTYRVLRALEVAIIPPSEKAAVPEKEFVPRIYGLDWPREVLYERINSRVDDMMAAGLMNELRGLREKWGAGAPALGGVGYKQMLPVLEDASLSAECLELWKRDTRRYGKRQMTWFRHQLEVEWLSGELPLREMGDLVAAKL